MLSITLQWNVCPFWSEEADEVAVWVDVSKIDHSWANDRSYYVASGGTGAAIGDRYTKAGACITSGEPIWMVAVCLDMHTDEIAFSDGRHRFAWLRDHGVRALPLMVPPDQSASIKSRFGTRRRISRLGRTDLT